MKLYKIVLWIIFLTLIYFIVSKSLELKRSFIEREHKREEIINEIHKNFKPREKGFYENLERDR